MSPQPVPNGHNDADERLIVNEVFGPTVQGEGPSIGRRAGFIRLGRCSLDCVWCDSRFSWDWEHHDPAVELHARTAADLLAEVEAMDVPLVVITGGEPLLQQRRLEPLVQALKDRGHRIEVETNGTIAPELADVDGWNVSPKLANSAVAFARRYRPDVLRAFAATGRAVFKFVVTTAKDLDEIAVMVKECGLSDVWVMPEGTDAETLDTRGRALGPLVVDRGWNFTPRLHILIWGNRRGV